MSHNVKQPNVSAPVAEAAMLDPESMIRAIVAAVGPGVVKSALIAGGLFDPQLSGVVIDTSEPGGGYVVEQELAQGVTYIVLGVGVGNQEPGITVVKVADSGKE